MAKYKKCEIQLGATYADENGKIRQVSVNAMFATMDFAKEQLSAINGGYVVKNYAHIDWPGGDESLTVLEFIVPANCSDIERIVKFIADHYKAVAYQESVVCIISDVDVLMV